MAYCTVTDVQTLIKSLVFGAGTKVTDTEITSYHIPMADAIIDGKLRKCYSVPISNTDDLKLLKPISMHLTAGIVARILYETTTQPNENAPAWRKFEDIGERLLNQIIAGEITLVTGRTEMLYSRVEDLYEEQDQDELEPLITMGKEF